MVHIHRRLCSPIRAFRSPPGRTQYPCRPATAMA